ncbi:MAG TPA: hypothetical protein VMI54_16995 [Polyangiaceae bacterium]|nr:hypothetical protein [Polyangiaceae bacterium]
MNVRRAFVRAGVFGAWLGATAGACNERCDPGYHLSEDLCYVDPPDAGADAGSEAGAAGAPSAPTCDDASVTTFGASCHSNADCTCDSDFCAGYPGQVGSCTRTGCLTDPSVCPDGYSCMDLSSFGAGLPAICVKS